MGKRLMQTAGSAVASRKHAVIFIASDFKLTKKNLAKIDNMKTMLENAKIKPRMSATCDNENLVSQKLGKQLYHFRARDKETVQGDVRMRCYQPQVDDILVTRSWFNFFFVPEKSEDERLKRALRYAKNLGRRITLVS